MDNCEKFKDLILTDYIDGELDWGWQKQVASHLEECADCRAFAEDVRNGLIAPFEQAVAEPVPTHLWTSIKNKIESQSAAYPLADFIDRLKASFNFLRPSPVLLSVAVLVVVGTLIFRYQQVKTVKEKDENEELAYILGSADTIPENEDNDLGTSIEAYFL